MLLIFITVILKEIWIYLCSYKNSGPAPRTELMFSIFNCRNLPYDVRNIDMSESEDNSYFKKCLRSHYDEGMMMKQYVPGFVSVDILEC